jgi:hypothetical protein
MKPETWALIFALGVAFIMILVNQNQINKLKLPLIKSLRKPKYYEKRSSTFIYHDNNCFHCIDDRKHVQRIKHRTFR